MPPPDSPVHRYHDSTKHHFSRFARSLGYLDWASQPHPFRSFSGSTTHALAPAPGAAADMLGPFLPPAASYDDLFDDPPASQRLTAAAIGDLLRHALGLSAWKQFGASRWALRVNPSSGNLHPTEAYVVCGALPGLADTAAVYHYAPDRHVLETRCRFDHAAWDRACAGSAGAVLVALTSIHWREAWKYGERAFRYCQHDLGHALAAVAAAAALHGWRAVLLPSWSHREIAALVGTDRDEDFFEAEREDPAGLLALVPNNVPPALASGGGVLPIAVQAGEWSGRASQLSVDHVQWTLIDEVAAATEDGGRHIGSTGEHPRAAPGTVGAPVLDAPRPAVVAVRRPPDSRGLDARALIRQRRSAVSFDSISSIDAAAFFAMLSRAMPRASMPWTTLWWTPRIHLLLFVHRVEGLPPGIYLLGREPEGAGRLRAAMHRELLDEPAHDTLPLVRLARGECRALARRLSCDQDIASDGFFSLGMIAEFDASLAEHGPSFYRHLFWESGVIGQVLYLEAEAAGARATGIGCFYDDAVHDVLGLEGHAFQSLYHFTVGVPVEDRRLTTAPGYAWEM